MNSPPPHAPRAARSAALIAAWKKLAIKHHPDKAANKEKAQAKMIEINVRGVLRVLPRMHAPWGVLQPQVQCRWR